MPGRVIPWVLLLAAAVLLGYLCAPRYRPPHQDAEARLRLRAAEFYRAQRLFDAWGLVRKYTPAHQAAESAKLRDFAANRTRQRASFDSETIHNLERSAQSIDAQRLEIEREGDWAVTRGSGTVFSEGEELPLELDEVVWVHSGGDWWVYLMTNAELNAYGNPPDFARQLLATREFKDDAAAGLPLEPAPQPDGAPADGAEGQ